MISLRQFQTEIGQLIPFFEDATIPQGFEAEPDLRSADRRVGCQINMALDVMTWCVEQRMSWLMN